MKQLFNQLKEKTNTFSKITSANSFVVDNGSKIKAIKVNPNKLEPTTKPITNNVKLINNKVELVTISQLQKVDMLMYIIKQNSKSFVVTRKTS